MRIEFDYQLEDVEEVLIPESYAGDRNRYRRRIRQGFIGWILIPFVVAGLYLFYSHLRSQSHIFDPENPPRDLQMDLSTCALPGTLAFLIACILSFLLWRKSKWRPKVEGQSVQSTEWTTKVIVWFFVSIILGMGFVSLAPVWTYQWHPSHFQLLALSWGPWVGATIMLMAFGGAMGPWQARQMWFNNPGFARRSVVEFDVSGFKESDGLIRTERDWKSFARARETAGLFVLVTENKQIYVIPKRAFDSEADIQSVRALLQNVIANTTFLTKPGGFMVMSKPVETSDAPA